MDVPWVVGTWTAAYEVPQGAPCLCQYHLSSHPPPHALPAQVCCHPGSNRNPFSLTSGSLGCATMALPYGVTNFPSQCVEVTFLNNVALPCAPAESNCSECQYSHPYLAPVPPILESRPDDPQIGANDQDANKITKGKCLNPAPRQLSQPFHTVGTQNTAKKPSVRASNSLQPQCGLQVPYCQQYQQHPISELSVASHHPNQFSSGQVGGTLKDKLRSRLLGIPHQQCRPGPVVSTQDQQPGGSGSHGPVRRATKRVRGGRTPLPNQKRRRSQAPKPLQQVVLLLPKKCE